MIPFANTAHFCIHMLGACQLDMAMHFANQSHDFSGLDWAGGPTDTPALEGVLAQFHCSMFAVHSAGDHSVIIGEITHARACAHDRDGLIFDRGRFGAFVPTDTV